MAQPLNDGKPLGPRELQRLETRRSLAEHAIRLFKAQGFDETTVEEIASAAGVSTRTFFLHFPSKAAAAFPDHGERVTAFVEHLMDGAPHVNPMFHLRVVLLGRLETTDPSRLARYTLLSKVPELRDEDARTDRDYENAIAEYLMLHWGRDAEAELRANAIANTVIGVARAALSVGGEHGLDVRRAADEIMSRMFGTPFDEPLHSL
jgi:AcrR family transcriptional regulator